MRKLALLLFFVMISVLFAGCSLNDKYDGKWISSRKSDWDGTLRISRMEIKKNGENYIIDRTNERYKDAGDSLFEKGKSANWETVLNSPVSATLQDGKLVVDPVISFTFLESDGTILGPEGEIYVKNSDELFQQLKKEAGEIFLEKHPRMILTD